MFSYRVHSFERPTHITFKKNERIILRVNMKKYFPKYVLCEEDLLKKYFLDINTRELVLIENQHEFMKGLRGPTAGHLSYDGEIFINLHNVGVSPQVISQGDKLAQGVFVKISTPSVVEISEDLIYDSPTDRGSGGFGSTGDK